MRSRDRKLLSEVEAGALDESTSLATTLRKVVALGGEVGSADLREWATRELRGYVGVSDDEIPDYRKVPAVIMIDGSNIRGQIKNQQISRYDLPDFAQDLVGEGVTLTNGVGELESMRGAEVLRLSIPGSAELVKIMNHQYAEAGLTFQAVERVYWSVGRPSLTGVLDAIRTTLVELASEMRAGMSADEAIPSADVADQAVSVAVSGNKARVTITSAQASGNASSRIETSSGGGRFWVVLGSVAAVAAVIVGIAAWQGWWT